MHPQLQRLQEAAQGLLYMSETDAPLLAFELGDAEGPPETALPALAAAAPGSPVERVDLSYFFRNHSHPPGDAGAEGAHRATRYQALQQQIEATLRDVAVYRVGAIRIDAFILGTLPDGSRGGLRTLLVET